MNVQPTGVGKTDLLHNFYALLCRINFEPKHIVDVGANHGFCTRQTLSFFPDAYYTLVEPQKEMENSVLDLLNSNPKISFHAKGAGKENGTFKFTLVERDDSCNFLITSEEATQKGFRQIDVPIVTLDSFLPTLQKPLPDLIKIDAEGLDLDVLAGCSNYFGKTEVFMVEAAVVTKELNNSIQNVLNFMDAHGYRMYDVTDLNRTPTFKALWLVELVFIKKNSIIDGAITSYN